MLIDRQYEAYSSEVELYLELDNGRRLEVSQVGTDSLIVRDDGGEHLSNRMAKLIIVVDGVADEYDVILSAYSRDSRVAEFA